MPEESADRGEHDNDSVAEESADRGEHNDNSMPEESADTGEHNDNSMPEESADREGGEHNNSMPEESAEGRDAEAAARGGRRMGRRPRVETPEMEAARLRSQAIADRNLATVRTLATKHPELQPQVGFAGKRLG